MQDLNQLFDGGGRGNFAEAKDVGIQRLDDTGHDLKMFVPREIPSVTGQSRIVRSQRGEALCIESDNPQLSVGPHIVAGRKNMSSRILNASDIFLFVGRFV